VLAERTEEQYAEVAASLLLRSVGEGR
jgi:hypothetical protein